MAGPVVEWKGLRVKVLSYDLLAVFASLFVGNPEHYAVQQRNGSYWRVCEPLTLDLVAAHLEGRVTLGTYLLDSESCCAFAVFDADSGDGLEKLVVNWAKLRQILR